MEEIKSVKKDKLLKKYGGNHNLAQVVELVDTRDLKSLDSNIVPVQVRPRVPSLLNKEQSDYFIL